MNPELRSRLEQWLDWDHDEETRGEIETLKAAENWSELDKRLIFDIQFGTAGLRGRMQAGFAFINSLTVLLASQGIADYMLSSIQHDNPKDLSVLIGHDTRHRSARFANLAAAAFASKGITVHCYDDYVPTPFVSFGVLEIKASVGVMITASHNPAMDNGYKVYWSNGCQINTPLDQHIAAAIKQSGKPSPELWVNQESIRTDGLRKITMDAYIDRLNYSIKTDKQPMAAFVYTPMHGVGNFAMQRVAKEVLYSPVIVVDQQQHPDPDFPTVKFPNPEESRALDLAFETANRKNIDVVIANDPDADRLAVAERIDDDQWHKFTGDQLGVLLASYLLEMEARTGHEDQKVAVLASAVSSGMLRKMVAIAGRRFQFEETLTGFKWIGNRARTLAEDGYTPLFGYEEALGYMLPTISYDKDGIAAAALYLSARAYWETRHLKPYQKLLCIYEEIGYHESINTYFISPSPTVTTKVFDWIRQSEEVKKSQLGAYIFEKWRDVTNGIVVGQWDNELTDSGSQMLTFVLMSTQVGQDSRVSFTFRGSGTEPKLKLYLEASSSDKETADIQAAEVVQLIMQQWLSKFGSGLTYANTLTSSSGRTIRI